jgi:TolA-binding protein
MNSARAAAIILAACTAAHTAHPLVYPPVHPPVHPAARPQQKKADGAANPQVASLQRQIKDLQGSLDELRQENSELQRQMEEAAIQGGQAREELDQLKATLRENQSGGDSLLKELQQAKTALAKSEARAKSMEAEAAALRGRIDDASPVKDGAFVHLGPDVAPAECINLRRMTPKVKRAPGVVVVNVLISEQGEPLDVLLLQRLPGPDTAWTEKAHEACLEAAKRLAFRPATTKDGSIRLKVWQGVGFYLE